MVILDYLLAANALYGLFMALIFYAKTDEAREEWYYIFFHRNQISRENSFSIKRRSSAFSLKDSDVSRISDGSMLRSNSVISSKEIEVSVSPMISIVSVETV